MNRTHQYGKTTTLKALRKYLKDEYIVTPLDFQMLSHNDFLDEGNFIRSFVREMLLAVSMIEGLRVSAVEKLAALCKIMDEEISCVSILEINYLLY